MSRANFTSLTTAAVCTSLLLSACASGTTTANTTTTASAVESSGTATSAPASESAPAADALSWKSCGRGGSLECASVTVPWDHADPTAGTLDIPIIRRAASGPGPRLGTIVFNPGGPGVPGTEVLDALIGRFAKPLRQRFDIVSFDPRGTGDAQRVDCGVDDLAIVELDQTGGPGSAASNAWASMAEACRDRLGDRMGLVSTAQTVKDVDLIRQALGVETIDWFGTSYGVRLGVEYLRQFPDRVRSMVLDAPRGPDAALDEALREFAGAAEPGVERLLSACANEDPCPLGADPLGAYDALAARLAREPLVTSKGRAVGLVDLQLAAIQAASLPVFNGHAFIAALAADGTRQADALLAAWSQDDGSGHSTIDASWAITCNDYAVHLDATAVAALVSELSASAPRSGLGLVTTFVAPCEAWPAPPEPVLPTNITTDVPVLVIGSTGDPISPYAGSQRMVGAISGAHLLSREGDGHTVFYSTVAKGCSEAAIASFFVDLNASVLPQSCPD